MTPTAPALVPPAAVRVIDVEAQLGDLRLPSGRGGDSYRSLLAVARLGGDPLGTAVVSVDPPGVVPGGRLEHELRRQLDRELQEAPGERGAHGRPPRSGPAVTVVVTTCRRPEALARCLRSILACEYEEFEVIVVENRPGSSATSRMLAEEFLDHPRVRYVDEPWPGVSRARNAGLALAEGELVAFTDDDVLVEPGWLGRCVAGFERSEDVACVTGLILPPGLESDDALLLERFAGVGKGFQRRIYRPGPAENGYLSLLLAPGVIGSGANTVLRTGVARELGGFDVSLGAGTPAGGGEGLDLYVRLLRDGRAVAYEPSAIVWHTHPDGDSSLRRQVRRHGVGLGALLTKQLITGPERGEALRAVPASIGFGRYGRHPGSRKTAGRFRHVEWQERLGMLIGAHAYSVNALGTTLRARRGIQPADVGDAQRSYVERLVRAEGETLELAPLPRAGAPPPARVQPPASVRSTSPALRAMAAIAVAACVQAPLLVAAGVQSAVAFPALIALLCLAPATALLTPARGRLEVGLMLGIGLAAGAVVIQATLELGGWWPKALLYVLAAACLPLLLGRLTATARPRPPTAACAPRSRTGQ